MMGSFSHAMGLPNGYKLHYDYPLGEKKLLLGTNPPFYIAKSANCETQLEVADKLLNDATSTDIAATVIRICRRIDFDTR